MLLLANCGLVYCLLLALVLSDASFQHSVGKHPCLIIGDGAVKFESLLPKINAHFTKEVHYPSSDDMLDLALKKFEKREFESLAYFEPFYLKDFQTTPQKK